MSEISLDFCKAKVSQYWETDAEKVRLNKQDLSRDCYHIQTMRYTEFICTARKLIKFSATESL